MDTRDFKTYWVAKLKDGNCWMTQNLDFDIPEKLNSSDTDISSISVTTDTIKVATPSDWNGNNDNPKYNAYYDPGDYIYTGPNGTHGQGTRCDTAIGLSECKTNYSAQWDTTGDTHYHVGNYYSFSAATVKSGDALSTRGDQAPDSICPRNWQLPTSGTYTSGVLLTNGKTFAKLFEAYGWTWDGGYYASNLNGGTSYYIYNTPFYFVYGGVLASGALGYAGNLGTYWSSTVASSTGAFDLVLESSVFPASSNAYSVEHYLGFSVRCVAE